MWSDKLESHSFCNQLAGWAWDSTQPNTSINVDIYDGTTFVATVLASNFRQDLYNAGYGNGNHGYSFSTPASLKNNQYHYIYVKYGGTSLLLNNSYTPLYSSTARRRANHGRHDDVGPRPSGGLICTAQFNRMALR